MSLPPHNVPVHLPQNDDPHTKSLKKLNKIGRILIIVGISMTMCMLIIKLTLTEDISILTLVMVSCLSAGTIFFGIFITLATYRRCIMYAACQDPLIDKHYRRLIYFCHQHLFYGWIDNRLSLFSVSILRRLWVTISARPEHEYILKKNIRCSGGRSSLMN